MKKHNFSAGPSILPQPVIHQSAQAILDFENMGLSIMEISHRDKKFVAVMEQARSLAIELLGLEGKDTKPYSFKEEPVCNSYQLPITYWRKELYMPIQVLGLQTLLKKHDFRRH